MKKLRIFSVLLLLVSIGVFIAYRGYDRVIQDNKPPVVACESDTLTVSVGATEEDLMAGVTAKDSRSGDVTDTLVLESLSAFTDEGTRIATYAAVDKNMNVGRAERTIVYEDYKEPAFHLSAPLSYTVGETLNVLKNVSADSVLDGDLSSNIKYSLQQTINTQVAGDYPIEFRVMDSAGRTVYLNTLISVVERGSSGIKVSLNDYLIYLSVGDGFDPWSYYAGADREGEVDVQSNVDTSQAGTYYVDYIVNGESASGRSRLTVVVR